MQSIAKNMAMLIGHVNVELPQMIMIMKPLVVNPLMKINH